MYKNMFSFPSLRCAAALLPPLFATKQPCNRGQSQNYYQPQQLHFFRPRPRYSQCQPKKNAGREAKTGTTTKQKTQKKNVKDNSNAKGPSGASSSSSAKDTAKKPAGKDSVELKANSSAAGAGSSSSSAAAANSASRLNDKPTVIDFGKAKLVGLKDLRYGPPQAGSGYKYWLITVSRVLDKTQGWYRFPTYVEDGRLVADRQAVFEKILSTILAFENTKPVQ